MFLIGVFLRFSTPFWITFSLAQLFHCFVKNIQLQSSNFASPGIVNDCTYSKYFILSLSACCKYRNIAKITKSNNVSKAFCLFKRAPGRLKKGTKISGHSHFNKFACPYFPFSNIPMYEHCTVYCICPVGLRRIIFFIGFFFCFSNF